MKLYLYLVIIASIIVTSPGCISVGKTKQVKRPMYYVTCERPHPKPGGVGTNVGTRVHRFRTADAFDLRRIVVLDKTTGKISYVPNCDYALVPGKIVTEQFRDWLSKSHNFGVVVDSASRVHEEQIEIEGWIDFAGVEIDEAKKYKFRLDVTFWVQGHGIKNSTYFRGVVGKPLDNLDPVNITKAFSMAMSQIFSDFEMWYGVD